MKLILVTLLTLFISQSVFSKDIENITETFHSNLEERSPEYYNNPTIKLLEEIPAEIEVFTAGTLIDLVNFAISLDLFSKGFEYNLNDQIFEITNEEGQPIAYTFSITIKKDGKVSSVGMYELHRRFDGVFYQSREAAWY
jgi:hypothetical protein